MTDEPRVPEEELDRLERMGTGDHNQAKLIAEVRALQAELDAVQMALAEVGLQAGVIERERDEALRLLEQLRTAGAELAAKGKSPDRTRYWNECAREARNAFTKREKNDYHQG